MINQSITRVRVVSPWRQMRNTRAVAIHNTFFGVSFLLGGLYSFSSSTNTPALVFSSFMIILGAIPLINLFFTIISPITIYLYDKHLLSTGECVNATIIDVLQSHVKINKDSTYFIVCEWTDRKHGNISCTSSLFLDNPVEILNNYNINTFPVYFKAKNPKRCVMDTSSIE